jgi:hypothetical protein
MEFELQLIYKFKNIFVSKDNVLHVGGKRFETRMMVIYGQLKYDF